MSGQTGSSPPQDPAGGPLRAEDLVSQLTEHYGATLFLGVHSASDTLARLEARGVPARLEELGFGPLHLDIGAQLPEGQTLRVYHEAANPDALLMEFRLRLQDIAPALRLASVAPLQTMRFLRVEWALLQNPRAEFMPDRPRLPDQRHPGLGIGHEVSAFLDALAKEHRLDGLLFFPQHYHNAALYSQRYVFFHPARQGAHEAMMRDLKERALADRSFAIDGGFLRRGKSGAPAEWSPSEMIRPLSRRLEEIIRSRFWWREARAARKGTRWRIDWKEYERWRATEERAAESGR
ncbi:MAG: hypothetical protein Q8R92_09435 [Deltaproteobacteria bacterium]|nr:hypothetical protein [Deltaproteobacteria bacterium]